MENNEAPEWQPPPPPEKIVAADPPQMSEVSTLLGIFIEPGKTFEDLKRRPRFIIGALLIAVLGGAWIFALQYKVGQTAVRQMVVQQIESSPQTASMPAEQKTGIIDMNMTIQGVMPFIVPIILLISILIGGLFYFLGAKAFGGTGGFLHNLSVWIYAWIPPMIVSTIANFIVLAIKSSEEIDLVSAQRGVVQANPSMFIDGKAQPVLATILGTFDIFMIWGWVLAAIGLRITNKLSSGSAWAIVIIFALVGTLFRVVGSYFSGNPS